MPEISLTAQEMRQGLHMLLWHFQTERLTVTFKKILEHQLFFSVVHGLYRSVVCSGCWRAGPQRLLFYLFYATKLTSFKLQPFALLHRIQNSHLFSVFFSVSRRRAIPFFCPLFRSLNGEYLCFGSERGTLHNCILPCQVSQLQTSVGSSTDTRLINNRLAHMLFMVT